VSGDKQLFPARPLFSITATDMGRNVLTYAGPMGTRTIASPKGGEFHGERLSGRIAPGLASEWQLESVGTPGHAHVEGLITLLHSGGEAILMKYMGRRSARYGEYCWRVGVGFEAPAGGALDWLNDLVAVAHVERIGDDLRYTVFELLGRQSVPDANALPVEPLYTLVATAALGERHLVRSPVSTRYMTIAEEGCTTQGRLNAHWPVGFAWGPHRTARTDAGDFNLPFHIDMRVGLVADNGEALIQSYLGTTPRSAADPSPDADRSWITAAAFEAPAQGPLAYLNDVIALGLGWVENNEVCYEYRIWA